jgi:hypothetical protein
MKVSASFSDAKSYVFTSEELRCPLSERPRNVLGTLTAGFLSHPPGPFPAILKPARASISVTTRADGSHAQFKLLGLLRLHR